MSVTHHNLGQLVVVGLVVSLIAGWLAWRSRGVISRLVLLAIALALLVPSTILGVGMNPWLVDARFRNYRQFYWSIRKGMTREDVVRSLDGRYPLGGPRLRPVMLEDNATRLAFVMNPENTAEPDRETITLTMDGGKVTDKEYLPDR